MAVKQKQRQELSADDRRRITDALTEKAIRRSGAWDALKVLSGQTTIDEIEVLEEEITGTRARADGIFNIYVKLQYEKDDNDGFTSSDSYPGRFTIHFDESGSVIFDEIAIDVSSFYA